MNTTDVHGTLREMWETRPARPRDDRQVAGVASAIARRYDIDPTLVRIGFVVAAFTGIGAALYIAGWIALPEAPEDPASPGRRSPRGIMVIALAAAAAATLGTLFTSRGGFVLPTLAALALLFLLHRSRGRRVGGTSAYGPQATASADAPTVATPSTTAGPSLVKEPAEPTPPAWDPLGAAPFAWDLPEPSPVPAPAPPRPRRLPVTSVTLGIALLTGAATAVVLLLLGALSAETVPLLFGAVSAVIGAGLLVGAFVRSGRGLIPIALLLSALTWGAVAAPIHRWEGNRFGGLHAAPTTVAELQPSYQRAAGDITLDLRGLPLTGTDTTSVSTTVSLGAGDVTVDVPANADVTLKGSSGFGDVQFGDRKVSGPGSRLDVTDDLGADGVRSGRTIVLDLSTGAGDVEVHRG
jgi:phage shock protein PspC (stress-responsive transcriptional regulator)